MKVLRMVSLAAILALGAISHAQQAAATPSSPQSSINWFWAICDTKAVVDLDGNMVAGDDVYLQFFRENDARGAALSDLIRVSANGAFRTSQVINFPSGVTLGVGQFGSMRIAIASETDPTKASFSRVVNDVYDTCITPANPVGSITPVGSGAGSGVGQFVDPTTGVVVNPIAGEVIRTSGILKPGGGYLNPVYAQPVESTVQIGVRPSENIREIGRVTDVGLLFAECDQFPGADPGRLYDTDNLTVFWSWYARTAAQVRDHLAKAQYRVFFESPGLPSQIFPNVQVSPIVRREDGNFYVFYTVNLGNNYLPGIYRVNYEVGWSEPTFDGYENFGPGTENEILRGSCTWEIEKNPYGVNVNYNNPRIFGQ
jgi:hypothetical protein